MPLTPPILYLIADREFAGDDRAWLQRLEDLARAAESSAGEVNIVLQVRAKNAPADRRASLLEAARDAAASATPVLINGSLDEAVRHGFDGVHWPESRIPDEVAGSAELLRSASVHSVAALKRAVAAGVDAVLFAPVFDAGSKDAAGVGLDALAAVAAAAPVPVIALGGISAERAPRCLKAGASGIGTVSAVMHPEVEAVTAIATLSAALRPGKAAFPDS